MRVVVFKVVFVVSVILVDDGCERVVENSYGYESFVEVGVVLCCGEEYVKFVFGDGCWCVGIVIGFCIGCFFGVGCLWLV